MATVTIVIYDDEDKVEVKMFSEPAINSEDTMKFTGAQALALAAMSQIMEFGGAPEEVEINESSS